MIIGVTGKKRAGKDTVAAYLEERHGFARVAFADPVKDLAYRLDPLIEFNKSFHDLQYVVDLVGWEDAKAVPHVRQTLQRLGNEIREVLGPEVWVDHAMIKAARNKRTVISDVRYPNEASKIRAQGGRVIKIIRPDQETTDTHPSETGVDLISPDFTIVNDRSKEDLLSTVEDLVGSWGLGSTV